MQISPPDVMKKNRFMTCLKGTLHWCVELKQPKSFEEAVEISKSKEWKLGHLA